jgi:catechol 2,3-dioxygenase-like lactoylglutathione lyase family enzyme
MATNYPINPRVRAFGKARLDIAGRAKNQAQWEKLWKHPVNSFPFVWGESWKQCFEYRVDDFPAEVGFYIDVLGLPINALDPGYAMFTSPQSDFFFSVVPTPHNEPSTPPDAIRLQFMVKDIITTTQELQQRGIDFEQTPQPLRPGSSLSIASFRTPHGICVELWGKVETSSSSDVELSLSKDQESGNGMEDEDIGEFESDEDEQSVAQNNENGELITGLNGNDDEGELEGGKETGEDSDDDDLGEDLDGNENEEDLESGEDEDEFDEDDESDGDEDVIALKSDPQLSIILDHTTPPREAKSKSPDNITGDLNKPGPEYIDLDVT